MELFSPAGLRGEFLVRVKENDGSYKKLWNENFIGKFIREKLGFELRISFITGLYKDSLHRKNLIVTTGKAGAALRLGSNSTDPFTYLALGIGTTAAAAGDTELESEITDSGLERSAATVSQVTTTTTDDTHQLVKTWTASGAKALTEIGALNAAAAGTLLGRQVFAVINIASGNQIEFTYKFPVTTA